MATEPAFRFDRGEHRYFLLDGTELPHITGMLTATGRINPDWYTEEGSRRGTAVHKLTADFDLGALHVESCVSPYRGYLLGHVKAMGIMRPVVREVEVPHVHPQFFFGGRPDRLWDVYGLEAIAEVKTGDPEKWHGVQLALQAILYSGTGATKLPPRALARFCIYLRDKGKYHVEELTNGADFDHAYEVIRTCCAPSSSLSVSL